MDNEAFYVAAVTVIPLLLIAVMATRSLRVGEFSSQPRITVLIFGLPVLGELGAFAYLFFEPVPTAAAVILALVTWAGLLSQLGVAVWWCAELIRHPEVQQPVPSNGGALEVRQRSRRSFCPTCGAPLLEGSTFCENCGTAAPAMFGDSTPEKRRSTPKSDDHQASAVPAPSPESEKPAPPEKGDGEQGQEPGANRAEPAQETRTSALRQTMSHLATGRCPACGGARPGEHAAHCPFCTRPDATNGPSRDSEESSDPAAADPPGKVSLPSRGPRQSRRDGVFCPMCARVIPPGSDFCPWCGSAA